MTILRVTRNVVTRGTAILLRVLSDAVEVGDQTIVTRIRNILLTDGAAISDLASATYVPSGSFTPDFVYRFEGTNGTAIANSDTAIPGYSGATILSRYNSGTGYGGSFSTAQTFGGRATSGKFRIQQNDDGENPDMGFHLNLPTAIRAVQGDTLHIRMRLFIPTGFSWDVLIGTLKFWRWTIHPDNDLGQASIGRLDDWLMHGSNYAGTNGTSEPVGVAEADQSGWVFGSELNGGEPTRSFPSNKIFTRNTWQTFESRVVFTTTAASAVRRLWTNATFACERVGTAAKWKNQSGTESTATVTAIPTLESATDGCPNAMLITYWNGGDVNASGNRPTQNQELFCDEIIVHKNTATLPQTDEYGNAFIGDAEVT